MATDIVWLDLCAFWVKDKDDRGRDGRTYATGRLDNEFAELLGLPEGLGVTLRINEKGGNANRPDFRVGLALDPGTADRLKAGKQPAANPAADGDFDVDDDDPFSDV